MEKQDYPMINTVRTGRRMKEVCESKNISARDLQEIMQLASVQAVYNWFKGVRLPNIDNLFAFSRLLGVSLDDLLVAEDNSDIGQQLLLYCNTMTE